MPVTSTGTSRRRPDLGDAAEPDVPGDPWITEIFVDPDAAGRGIGSALLARAAAPRWPRPATLGLAVTAGNPAHRLYASLGFVSRRTSARSLLPPA